MPRTPGGSPDMQGIWSNASQTPLVRPAEFGAKGFLTEQEAQAQMQRWQDRYIRQGQPIDGDRPPLRMVIQILDTIVFGGIHGHKRLS